LSTISKATNIEFGAALDRKSVDPGSWWLSIGGRFKGGDFGLLRGSRCGRRARGSESRSWEGPGPAHPDGRASWGDIPVTRKWRRWADAVAFAYGRREACRASCLLRAPPVRASTCFVTTRTGGRQFKQEVERIAREEGDTGRRGAVSSRQFGVAVKD